MDKLKVLLIMLLAATSGLAASMYMLALVLSPTEQPLSVLAKIITRGYPAELPFYIPLSTLLFLFTVLVTVTGIIYFLLLPEMKNYVSGNGVGAASLVLKTLKTDERIVVTVLNAHGGAYLQKYISKESGLSRLKTHRVVAALSERGIVSVEKQGNTNMITLSKWFKEGLNQ